MSAFEFSPAMCVALDAYRVPPLPEDFAERVVARALAASRQRAPAPLRTSRWRKAGRIVTGAALAGLLTATAAAAGWLGKPVYVPVISEIIERIAPQPAPVLAPAPLPAQPALAAPVEPTVAEIEPEALPAVTPEAARPVAAVQPEIARPEVLPVAALPVAQAAPTTRVAPDPIERTELRRELQRQPVEPLAPSPVAVTPAPEPTAVRPLAEPTRIPVPVDPAPTTRATTPPREVRPVDRVRTPAVTPTRTPRQPVPPAERRRELRERRVP